MIDPQLSTAERAAASIPVAAHCHCSNCLAALPTETAEDRAAIATGFQPVLKQTARGFLPIPGPVPLCAKCAAEISKREQAEAAVSRLVVARGPVRPQ